MSTSVPYRSPRKISGATYLIKEVENEVEKRVEKVVDKEVDKKVRKEVN